MLKKTITYIDFNGNEIKEDLYFNLSERELIEWETSVDGGIRKKMQEVMDKKEVPEIMAFFKDLIRRSYGIKSDDGKRFLKSEKISEEFMQSAAYDKYFMELFTEENEASKFISGVVPADLLQKAQDKKALAEVVGK